MILCVVSDESGLLVHCISGWDRTPLFVSLLRLSLWAVSAYFFFSFCLFIPCILPVASLHMTPSHPAAHLAPPTFISGSGNPTLNPSAFSFRPLLIKLIYHFKHTHCNWSLLYPLPLLKIEPLCYKYVIFFFWRRALYRKLLMKPQTTHEILFQTRLRNPVWVSGAAWHPVDDWPTVFDLAVWNVWLADIMYLP